MSAEYRQYAVCDSVFTFVIFANILRSGRSGAISTKKIKNNMLAAVLVLTVVPPWVKVGRAAVEHACYLISQKLSDVDEVSAQFKICI